MELTGKINSLNIDFLSGDTLLTLKVAEKEAVKQGYDDLKDKERLEIVIKPYRKKRSLNANAYAWKLITEIADKMRVSKDEIYLLMLKQYGQGGVVKIPLNDVEKFKRQFKYVEEHEKFPDDKGAKYLHFWVGSSHYDTEEMSIFIDGIVSEAEELGIQTKTPDELADMLSLWDNEPNG